MIRKALVLPVLLTLGGCFGVGAQEDRVEAERSCQGWIANGLEKRPMSQCVGETFKAYHNIRNAGSPTVVIGGGGGGYSPPLDSGRADAPASAPQQQIYYPTRCQTVPSGLGTYQTVCN